MYDNAKIIDTACLVSALRAAGYVGTFRASPRPLPVVSVSKRAAQITDYDLTGRLMQTVNAAVCHAVNTRAPDEVYTRVTRARSYLASRVQRSQSRSHDRDSDSSVRPTSRAFFSQETVGAGA